MEFMAGSPVAKNITMIAGATGSGRQSIASFFFVFFVFFAVQSPDLALRVRPQHPLPAALR
jgi:hypothetical protein